MNGERVGKWGSLRGAGTPFFRYEESWANAPQGRALSLSLPVTADRQLRGQAKERRSEEHTSELQSHSDLVCRLLLEKKKRYQRSRENRGSGRRCRRAGAVCRRRRRTHARRARAAVTAAGDASTDPCARPSCSAGHAV